MALRAVDFGDYTWTAFDALIDDCENAKSESARIAEATALLDRGFCKPREAAIEQFRAPSPLDYLDIDL